MVEFAETAMRHYCRNPKCRSKLKTPVSNSREAFCPDTTCKQRFYRLRCCVCEEKKPGRLDARTCGRRKCKNAIRSLKRPGDISGVEIGVKTSTNTGLPEGDKYGRRWVQIAGPALTPLQLHCATVPDGPNCQWTDGEFERIEARNRAALKAHFAKLGAKAIFQRHVPQLNVLGGYRFPNAPAVDLAPPGATAPAAPTIITFAGDNDDLSIPAFLRRPDTDKGAATPWRTRGTIRGQAWMGHKNIQHMCGTPSWRRIGSRISGATDRS